MNSFNRSRIPEGPTEEELLLTAIPANYVTFGKGFLRSPKDQHEFFTGLFKQHPSEGVVDVTRFEYRDTPPNPFDDLSDK